nr:MAG TPA: hypothetical protein [Caudoviricetes sp.]
MKVRVCIATSFFLVCLNRYCNLLTSKVLKCLPSVFI